LFFTFWPQRFEPGARGTSTPLSHPGNPHGLTETKPGRNPNRIDRRTLFCWAGLGGQRQNHFWLRHCHLNIPGLEKVSGILTRFINRAFASEVLSFQHLYLPLKGAQVWEEARADHELCAQLPSPEPNPECPRIISVHGYVVLALCATSWKARQTWKF
jgi:hypothetical protein